MNGCSGCNTQWTSLAWAHCGQCHETFLSVECFGTHRKGGSCIITDALTQLDGIWGRVDIIDNRREKVQRAALARKGRKK